MNENKNKVELIMMIATKLSDESCARILEHIRRSRIVKAVELANGATWDESEHPRADDGKFTRGGAGEVFHEMGESVNEDFEKMLKKLPKTPIGERLQWLAEKLTPHWKEQEGYQPKKIDTGRGHNIADVCKEKISQAIFDGDEEALKKWSDNLKKAQDLLSGEGQKKEKMRERVKRFREVEDEMDEIEEAYGDRDRGVGFKWTEDEDGDEARKRYRKLKRERAALERKIDWKEVED